MASLPRALFRYHGVKSSFLRTLCTVSTAKPSFLPKEAKKQLTEARKKAIRPSHVSLESKKIPLVEDLARKHEMRLTKESEEGSKNQIVYVVEVEPAEACPRGKDLLDKMPSKKGKIEVKKVKDAIKNHKETVLVVRGEPEEACPPDLLDDNKSSKKEIRAKKVEKGVSENGKEMKQSVLVDKTELAEACPHEKRVKKDLLDKKLKKKGKWRTKKAVEVKKDSSENGKEMKQSVLVDKTEPSKACPHGKGAEKDLLEKKTKKKGKWRTKNAVEVKKDSSENGKEMKQSVLVDKTEPSKACPYGKGAEKDLLEKKMKKGKSRSKKAVEVKKDSSENDKEMKQSVLVDKTEPSKACPLGKGAEKDLLEMKTKKKGKWRTKKAVEVKKDSSENGKETKQSVLVDKTEPAEACPHDLLDKKAKKKGKWRTKKSVEVKKDSSENGKETKQSVLVDKTEPAEACPHDLLDKKAKKKGKWRTKKSVEVKKDSSENGKETKQSVLVDKTEPAEACPHDLLDKKAKKKGKWRTKKSVEVKKDSSENGKETKQSVLVDKTEPAEACPHDLLDKKAKKKGKWRTKKTVEVKKDSSEKEQNVEKELTEVCQHRKQNEKDKLEVVAIKKGKMRTKKDKKRDANEDVEGKNKTTVQLAKGRYFDLSTARKIQEKNGRRFYYKLFLNEGGKEHSSLPTAIVSDVSKSHELVSHASKTIGVSDEDIPLFSANPSLLGVTQGDMDDLVTKLCRAGFTKNEAATLLPHYPAALVADFSTIHQVCALLQRRKIKWKNLISNCKFSFLHGTTQLEKNLKTLRVKFNLSPFAVEKMLFNLPMLFCCPISDQTITTYITAKAAGFNNSWLQCLLADSLECWPAKVSPLGPDTAELVKILHGLNINPNPVLARYPYFFSMKASSLVSLIKLLSSAPLYADTPILQKAITTIPHIVKEMAILEDSVLQNHFKELYQLYGSVSHLSTTPALLSPSCHIRKKLDYFYSLGFTNDETRELVNEVPCLLVQDMEQELKPRMELLLGLTDGNLQAIVAEKSKRFLSRDLERLAARIKFAQNHKVDHQVLEKRLLGLFVTSDAEFAKMG